jgi:hypothetical protein
MNSEYPKFDPNKGWQQFWIEVSIWEKKRDAPKKQSILNFINEWLNLKNKKQFKSFYAFRNIYLNELPDDKKSKQYLIENFNKYNDFFNLDLEYDEKLFTRYNVLYMLKLMLKQLDCDLKKIKINNNKIYSIVINKKLL